MQKGNYPTKWWKLAGIASQTVDNLAKHPSILEAAAMIRQDQVVAFPTETVYGLAANALSDSASEQIFVAKGRPADNPLIVHIERRQTVDEFVDNIPKQAVKLMETFWPGPLTIILPAATHVSSVVTAHLSTVALRMPDHVLALAFLRACQLPLAAPSANRSGKPSPTTAEHVWHDLQGRIAGILDGGPTGIGVESTVIDMSTSVPTICRPGGISIEQLQHVLGDVSIDPAITEGVHPSLVGQTSVSRATPRSPGVKYGHYSPEGEMWLSTGESTAVMRKKIAEHMLLRLSEGYRCGVLTTDEGLDYFQGQLVHLPFKDQMRVSIVSAGDAQDLEGIARQLYAVLRQFDVVESQYIFAETFPERGMGAALMNRLRKAASGNVL